MRASARGWLTGSTCAFALANAVAGPLQAQTMGELNRIVLRVNDEIATLHDYEKLKQERLVSLARATMPESRRQALLAQVGEETMRSLFEEMLVLSRADQLGVVVSQAQIDSAVEQTKASSGIQNNEQFRQALEQSGMTLEAFRDQMRRNMTVREVMGREVQARVALEEEDLRRYYRAHGEEFRTPKKIQLREIVVLDSSGVDAGGQQRVATELRQEILAGGAEEKLAEYKESGKATDWIEHGWVEPADLDAQLAVEADLLSAGEISEPIEARGGLHLLQVVGVEESTIRDFQEVRDEIEAKERNRLFNAELQSYMEDLVATSYIISNPPPDAATFEPFVSATGGLDEAEPEDLGVSAEDPAVAGTE